MVDSEPIWDAAKREVFGPLGLHLTTEMQVATRGLRQRDMVAYWFDRATLQADPDPDDVEQRIVAAVCRRLEGVALKPGAEHAVAMCARASRAMAVVSSSPESVIRHALASTGLGRSFDAVFSAEDDEHGKRHPGAYLRGLGHGYCTYTFFEQCQHRMACAKCDFYTPKDSTKSQILEAKGNLQRMLVTIPLTDDERQAVDDGQTALDKLLARLADVPTPGSPTPRQIGIPPNGALLPLVEVRRSAPSGSTKGPNAPGVHRRRGES